MYVYYTLVFMPGDPLCIHRGNLK